MAENKTKPTAVSVASYIAAIADETKRADARTLVKLLQGITGEKPKMWGPSIVGFGTVHYVYESGREGDMPLAAFSPRKAATVVYLTGVVRDSDALFAKLGKHSTSGGCLYIKKLTDVNSGVLEQLVVKSVKFLRTKYPSAGKKAK